MNPYGRPKKTDEEKGVQISIRLPKAMLEKLDLKSKYIGRSAFIRMALAELFEAEINPPLPQNPTPPPQEPEPTLEEVRAGAKKFLGGHFPSFRR